MLVEAIRLLITLTLTAVGFMLSSQPNGGGDSAADTRAILGAVVGAGVGYVVGGVVGRWIRARVDTAPDQFVPNRSGPELFAGAFGLVVGILVGAIAAVPLVVWLPAPIGWPTAALVVLIASTFGAGLFASRAEDLLGAAGLRGRQPLVSRRLNVGEDTYILDSSAAIDGRVLELGRAGLVSGRMWVPVVVIDELQGIADSPDTARRRSGRRGLDVIEALQDALGVEVAVLEDSVPEFEDVDAKLIALAERAHATLITTDHNLGKAAELRGTHVLNPHAVADLLKAPVSVGDRVLVPLSKAGSLPGQAVGYLADGSMVVVEGGTEHIGGEVAVEVTSTTRTSIGRMFFGRLDE